jgi:3-methyladenine DNA glycosylase AlkC
MEPLKELFNADFARQFARDINSVYSRFDQNSFTTKVIQDLPALELNQRLRLFSVVLKDHLPEHFPTAIELLKKAAPITKAGYTNLIYPDYVALYGKEHFDLSLQALEYFTQFGSSEFAIREFLRIDFNRTINVMKKWTKSRNEHVRRLASEGSRPRLPWSFKLDMVIKNPELTFSLLNSLKADSSAYVKKSVANHLNDISKDNPDKMIAFVKTWSPANTHSAWIIKHACRSLIKKGNSKSLALFGFEKNPKIKIKDFRIMPDKVKLGDSISISFELLSNSSKPQNLVVDYVMHYRKKSGQVSKKVFKWKEMDLVPKQRVLLKKKQLLIDMSTRKHFPGIHKAELQVNGKIMASDSFTLLK